MYTFNEASNYIKKINNDYFENEIHQTAVFTILVSYIWLPCSDFYLLFSIFCCKCFNLWISHATTIITYYNICSDFILFLYYTGLSILGDKIAGCCCRCCCYGYQYG